jgi:cystathionine beta-lyase/cystathionine gamma-synthase
MQAHQNNAFQVARFLESHPAVAKVNFPGLESHPDFKLGKQQLSGS